MASWMLITCKTCFYILKKPPRCCALASSRIAKQNSQIAPLHLCRVAFLFVLFACQMCVRFYMQACKTPARLTGLFQKNVWQPPALPCRLQHSTIGRTDLHRRVRDGNGCCLRTHRHQTDLSMFSSSHMSTRQKRNPYFFP